MLTNRFDRDNHTEITVMRNDAIPPWDTYRITCMDADIVQDKRVPPTAHISLLASTQADIAHTRRLAAEYEYVASIAEALQIEKRHAYAALQVEKRAAFGE